MENATTTSSRKSLLGRGLVITAGAIGLGAGGANAALAALPATTALRLYGRQLHLHMPSRRAGQVPVKGERHTGYAELLDSPDGSAVGHFTAAHLTLDSPFAEISSLEIHTFHLAGGTIHGLGSVARGAVGNFIVLGGTGRYSGVTGSYVARQGARELGGNGTAEFQFTLAGSEGPNGI